MSERADSDFLSDIQEAVRRIGAYTAAMTYKAFLTDIRTQDAVIRNLEIIEATKNLSQELRVRYDDDVPWREMAGVRDRLIHRYFGVNLDIVWQIASDELPKVASRIQEILKDEQVGE